MSPRLNLAIRHLAIIATLAAVIVWLWQLGHGSLAAPSLSIDGLRVWIDRRDTITLTFATVRLEALALAAYVLALSVVSGIVRVCALPRATHVVDRFTLPVLRGLLGGAAALGVMAAPVHVAEPKPPAAAPPVTSGASAPVDAWATLHLLPTAGETSAIPEVATTDHNDNTWVVQPGESFWSIAADHLADIRGGTATDREIDTLWRQLIDANRDRLVNPEDVDLLLVDQVLVLPAVDAG